MYLRAEGGGRGRKRRKGGEESGSSEEESDEERPKKRGRPSRRENIKGFNDAEVNVQICYLARSSVLFMLSHHAPSCHDRFGVLLRATRSLLHL